MTSYADAADLAVRELDACRGALLSARPNEWSSSTQCAGWSIEDLARHLAAVAWQQAEAFHRTRIGVAEAPSWLDVAGGPSELLDALSTGREHVAAGLAAVEPVADRSVPLPFAVIPAPIAASALVLEYGVHRHDLERALGRVTDIDLDPDVAAVVAELLPLLVPVLAEKAPAAPITYRLTSDSSSAAITWRDDAWQTGEGDGAVCDVRGSDAAIALLALGRIAPSHPSLTVAGATDAAADLPVHIRTL